jgi:MerR family transcriptional regulator, light-induced transcriptional regulator
MFGLWTDNYLKLRRFSKPLAVSFVQFDQFAGVLGSPPCGEPEVRVNANLSPKDLAMVIGVSESSLKRWVDEGRLQAARTAGGHRRIPLHEAVRFIRASNASLTRPELLGLPDLTPEPLEAVASGSGEAALLAALEAGKAEAARGLIVAHFLATRSVASVCDGPIAHALHRIGELWRHNASGILIEHRATDICIQAMHQIRLLMPPLPADAPIALGAGMPHDPYVLPTLMASTTMLENGYRDMNYGADTPVEELARAVEQHQPRVVWLAVSATVTEQTFFAPLEKLARVVAARGATLVLGGRGLFGLKVPPLPSTHIVSSMAELSAVARVKLGRPLDTHSPKRAAPLE